MPVAYLGVGRTTAGDLPATPCFLRVNQNLLIDLGKPPAMLGDSQSLTVPGAADRETPPVNRSKFTEGSVSLDDYASLNHTRWDCKYHVVFIPKYRRKALYGELRVNLGSVFRSLAAQKECNVEEGHLMTDHVHILLSIPPKYAVSQVVGYIKGKSAIHIARTFMGKRKNFTGQNFWARGYFVSTVGRDEEMVREYIRRQEAEDQRMDQLMIWKE
jgi:putative transposase